MEQRWQQHKDSEAGYLQYMVIGQTNNFTAPTAQYCKQIRTQYGLTFPVLYDPDGLLPEAYGYGSVNERNFVFGPGAVLVHVGHYTSQGLIDALIEGLLSP